MVHEMLRDRLLAIASRKGWAVPAFILIALAAVFLLLDVLGYISTVAWVRSLFVHPSQEKSTMASGATISIFVAHPLLGSVPLWMFLTGLLWLGVLAFIPSKRQAPMTLARLRCGGVHRRNMFLGHSLSAVVVDINNERGRKAIEVAGNVRANVTFRDMNGKKLTKVFRGLWWIDEFHASETTKILPEDQGQLAVLYGNRDSLESCLEWRPYPFDVDMEVFEKLHLCSQVDVELFVGGENKPQLRLSFSIDPHDQSLGMLPNIQLLDKA